MDFPDAIGPIISHNFCKIGIQNNLDPAIHGSSFLCSIINPSTSDCIYFFLPQATWSGQRHMTVSLKTRTILFMLFRYFK